MTLVAVDLYLHGEHVDDAAGLGVGYDTHAGGHVAPPEVDEAAWNWLFSRVRAATQRPAPRAG